MPNREHRESDGEIALLDHLPEAHVDAALGILFDAFAKKFRHGFRDAGDFRRLFRRDVRREYCYTAVRGDQLLGIVTYSTRAPAHREFYQVGLRRLLTTFTPVRTLRVLFNLWLLNESVARQEFLIESIAVSPAARGLGVGTRLMLAAEARARDEDYQRLALDVIGINDGAIRLYERLGYRIVKTTSGFWVRLATDQQTVHRMQKPLRSG